MSIVKKFLIWVKDNPGVTGAQWKAGCSLIIQLIMWENKYSSNKSFGNKDIKLLTIVPLSRT
jgi:hypothetical protein